MALPSFLHDKDYLYDLDNEKIKVQYVKIVLLTFDEEVIREIQGYATGGSVTVNGSAALRRTISLNMFADEQLNDLENVNNLISINKKFKVYVGYKNMTKKWKEKYGEISWFPLGLYLVSGASLTNSSSGISISVSGKDKMCLLDGSVGGMLPASVTFHEIYNEDENGDIYVTNPTMFQIIQESVVHYGKENVSNVIINDLENTAKMLVKYNGDTPIWFSDDYNSFVISDSAVDGFVHRYSYGQVIGYMETPMTYPGELVFDAGNTVVNLLDKICETLGNYEYFYDLDGHFVFQEKKNYLNNYYTPIVELETENYIQDFSNTKYAYTMEDANTTTSYNVNPQYDNIKNDYICWGTKTLANGTSFGIRYHLAIDKKPILWRCLRYMYPIVSKETQELLRYEYTFTENETPEYNSAYEEIQKDDDGNDIVIPPGYDWREELYRAALENSATMAEEGYYDQELLAEWRGLFDPSNEDYHKAWNEEFQLDTWTGWNPQVYTDPGSLHYWLDFIDSQAILDKYSVDNIGRRTKVINNNNTSTVYNTEVQDIIFLENNEDAADKIAQYNRTQQPYCLLKENQMDYFSISSTQASCFDLIRDALYQNLVYNTQITINCQPKYYIEPNSLIYVEDKNSGIQGDYFITNFNLPLSYNGTMSISATQLLTRI